MKIEGEFHIIETTKSENFRTYLIIPGGQPGDVRANYRDEAEFHKKVRLLRCRVVEVVEEQS